MAAPTRTTRSARRAPRRAAPTHGSVPAPTSAPAAAPGSSPAPETTYPCSERCQRQPEHVFRGMSCVDTSDNPRLPVIMEMVGAISRATEPRQVLDDFSAGLLKLEGPRGFISLSARGLEPGQYKITRMLINGAVGHMGEINPWAEWDHLPVHEGGFLGALIRQAYPEILHHVFLRDDPVLGDQLAGYGSVMAIPLFENGEPINWAIMLREGAEDYTAQDLEEAVLRSNLVGTTVRNVLALKQLREANDAIRREMSQIARIQRALLPRELPAIPGVRLGAHYETFDTAGGDMYDFAYLGDEPPGDADAPANRDGEWALLVADAAGHGPAAATVVAMLNAILYAAPDELDGPAEVLAFANRHLVAKGMDGTFVTAVLARYCPVSRRLMYARAGHPPVLLMTPGQDGAPATVRRLDHSGGVPLGVIEGVTYDQESIVLEPGQSLVFYTDGITEALSPDGRMFGVAGIEHSLTECSGDPDCAISHITESLRVHEAGVRPNDDQTIVVMKVN